MRAFEIMPLKLLLACAPYALCAAALDALAVHYAGKGGLLIFVIAFIVKTASDGGRANQSMLVVDMDGIDNASTRIGWQEIERVEMNRLRTLYQRVRISGVAGSSITLWLGLRDRDAFCAAVAALAPDSRLDRALRSPKTHPFENAAQRYSALILSLLGLSIVGVPYLVWIFTER